jgi:hypothetical protein
MTDNKSPQKFIKSKDKPEGVIGFRTSNFFRGKNFSPGGMKSGFAPKAQMRITQHKG